MKTTVERGKTITAVVVPTGLLHFGGLDGVVIELPKAKFIGLKGNENGRLTFAKAFLYPFGIFSKFRDKPPGGSIYGLGLGQNLPEAPLVIEMLLPLKLRLPICSTDRACLSVNHHLDQGETRLPFTGF